MGESKAERLKWEGRAQTQREHRAKERRGPSATPPALPHGGIAYGEGGCDALWDLLASGEFRSLIVRPDGLGGGAWTLKAVLDVSASGSGVYMHGVVKSMDAVPEIVDRCIRAGKWHADKFPRKE